MCHLHKKTTGHCTFYGQFGHILVFTDEDYTDPIHWNKNTV